METKFTFSDLHFENKRRKSQEFADIAKELRRDIIKSLAMAKSGHTGGTLGLSDIFSVLFFGDVLRYKADDPNWDKRDKFVLSGGHLCPVLYSCLARAGYFPIEELSTLRKYGTRLQGHPGLDTELPGIETAAGSLGQGISIAAGMAMTHKLLDKTDQRVFSLTGDGELQEGSVWETAMSAAQYKLDNLCWIVDDNDCQIDGRVKDVMNIKPLDKKFAAFGFNVIECDGHDIDDIINAFDKFIANHKSGCGKPTVIIAKTYMGRGVSFMEDLHTWHGNPPSFEQAEQALEELK
ncbi:MAG: transketolase [Chlorobi bacterium]|nr:transketolase [Chlorobiota bacterium]